MPNVPNAADVLDREFLELRARILQAAAQLDRVDRAGGNVADDPRWRGLHQAIEVLGRSDTGRAEKVQMIFSRPYDADWKQNLKIDQR
jgi:hypothetical protein